ncbi:hypothetical protein Mpet_1941 [Methanolacinia petrolearia DSM 11571]|uniref:WD40 domain protein beta Propeller n=1 Tax=Methanolacinia petrolearia (strain DSM 11571 / OCM 486 / SEBR 4847) TaxID=679926 RepID=E1RJ22_METP4|nr:PD40 domain-containing protein [Methanolacinia petrolearia]ADN36692.1 hypothetical protein Mpet_1941 [Methanolacinia petrolearia DSM 11571]
MDRSKSCIKALIIVSFGLLAVTVSAATDFTLSPDEPLFTSVYNYSIMTNTGESCNSPGWSLDGCEIAFVCRKWKEPCNCTSLWEGCVEGPALLNIMNSDGSDRRILSNLTVLSVPSWNPQGTHLLILGGEYTDSFQNPENKGYWLVAKDGSNQQFLFNDSVLSYSWSPDGSNIAYLSKVKGICLEKNVDGTCNYEQNAYVLKIFNLSTSLSRELNQVSDPQWIQQSIKWTEDGKEVVFLSQENRTSYGQYLLVRVNVETGQVNEIPVVTDSDYRVSMVAWNPCSDIFAYLTNTSFNNTNLVRIVDPIEGTDIPLTKEGYHTLLSWNPDGTRLGYSYHGDIWVINPDGTDVTRLTMNGSIRSFSWQPNGSCIVFNENEKVTDCEPQLGYFGIGWPQQEKIWQNWTTASRIGVMDLDKPVESSIPSPIFDILAVILATGVLVVIGHKRR